MAVDYASDIELVSVTVPGQPEVITISVPGVQGPPGKFKVGTVSTGAPGTSAAITTTENAQGEQVVSFAIPRGADGPANNLSIGTVATGAAGSSASASITGSSPSQVLNLTIPRGLQGDPGEKGEPGIQGIQGVEGPSGSPGPANSLSIGTVTTGAPGSTAQAAITGTAPTQTLNLTIPQGPAGAGAPDATTSAKGSIQLAGDLSGTASAPTVPALANKVNTDDTRLTNARTPLAHASTHATGGTDALTPANIGAASASHTHGIADLNATGTRDSTTYLRGDGTWAVPAGGGTVTSANITDATTTGRSVLTATDASAARTAIGAGTSSLVIGTTGTTAMAGNKTFTATDVGAAPASHTHTAANISDSTATGRSLITATDAAAARTAISAGTSNLAIGTTSTTAAAGDHVHTGYRNRTMTKTSISANYTILVGDSTADVVIHSTAATAITITVPSDATANIAQEVSIPWRQYGAGQLTFAAGTGATLISRGSVFKSAGQYAEGLITKVAANTWLLSGDIVA